MVKYKPKERVFFSIDFELHLEILFYLFSAKKVLTLKVVHLIIKAKIL